MSQRISSSTLCVRGPEPRQKPYVAVTTPIVSPSTYAFLDTAELRRHFAGLSDREEYGRYGNPTVRAAEQKVAALDGAEGAAPVPSGGAAGPTPPFRLPK